MDTSQCRGQCCCGEKKKIVKDAREIFLEMLQRGKEKKKSLTVMKMGGEIN